MNKENELIIDAEHAVAGRLASFAAKQSLQGNKIIIVNTDKAIIVGNKPNIMAKYQRSKSLGGGNLMGPYYSTNPEKLLKRMIRGMMDYKKGRGRDAIRRIFCYNGVPKQFESSKMIKSARGKKGITFGEITRLLKGGKE